MSQTQDARWQGLAALARVLGRAAHVDETLSVAADGLLAALDADSVSISRLEPGTWTLRTLINAGSLGPNEERLPTAEVYRLEDFAHFNHVFRDQRVWLSSLEDPDGDAADLSLLRELGKGSSLTAPLVVDGVLWGELYASWFAPIGAISAMHDGFLDALTAVLGGAISRALQTETLEGFAFRDALTGLANRRALDMAAEQMFAVPRSGSQRRVSVVAADVNGLKTLNDSAGHHHGDMLIRGIAEQILRQFKPLYGSLAARVGGDEFTILVPGHPIDTVAEAAGKVCTEVQMLPGSSGISCGVASGMLPAGGEPARVMFTAADKAMYEAKRAGAHAPVVTEWVTVS